MNRYRIKNWAEYNRSLVQRGSITVWFSQEALEQWYEKGHTCEKGRPRIYSDQAILCALILRTVYHLPLRALQGFLASLVGLMRLAISTPSYSQICRRARGLGQVLASLSRRRPCDIVFDSTGFKVYGEGEWKVRQHGKSKRRQWKKLHIGVDPDSGEILVAALTSNGEGSGDAETAQKLMKRLPKGIKRVYGDGAYDGLEFRRAIEEAGAEPLIPPPRGAVIHEKADPALSKRNDAILQIYGLGGDDEARRLWKKLKGYHRRSLVETSMYRIKQITGDRLRSRKWKRQYTEVFVKCLVINKMTKLGLPKGEWERMVA